ncbi:hypothetical protein [Flavobacterium ginsenosidimutans]|uniref:hypothetical protein n=1 Tax=Flavobacterium ginsenosidimutans TaxID=687844 RepID=UPI000DAC8A19|nr:hypothetical protein [Flavobacterium ginsenosidimutans]KAF2331084.1 hypothetical protein DM444_12460 [Flavobacterium ginsenosidimutans]
MKKLLALLCVVFMYACTSEDQDIVDSNGKKAQTSINPPAWICGSWSDSKGKIIEFTKNDIIIDPNGNSYSAKGEITYFIIKGEDPEIVETATDSTYNLQFNEIGSAKRNLKFIKISDSQIESKGSYKGIYTKK